MSRVTLHGFVFLIIFALANQLYAADSEWSGYFELQLGKEDSDTDGRYTKWNGRLKPTWKVKTKPGTLHLSYDLQYTGREGADSFDTEGSLHLAYLEIPGKRFDVTVGKQVVHWGSSQIWNPTDVFNQDFLVRLGEFRDGQYALRFDRDLNENVDLTMLVGFKDSDEIPDERVWAFRLGALVGVTDIAVVSSYDEDLETLNLGLDFKGDIGDNFGWNFEIANKEDRLGADWIEYVVGLDHTFYLPKKLLVGMQYYYNESGGDRPSNYDITAFLDGRRASLAQRYVSLAFDYEMTRRKSASMLLIRNLDDDSIRLFPRFKRTIGGNLDLILGGELGRGSEGEFNARYGTLTVEDPLPDRWFVYLKRYF